ncbi:MAG: RNA polymerase sigma factor [Verrucomicrobia bacterium]|nr:RNA polymerase sigma factor [Verrucomicrobiota bacterium]
MNSESGDTAHRMDATDKEHVEQCRNGHPDDYRFLVERYQGPVFAYLASRLGDQALAEDAAQESLVRAFFALPKLKKPESFYAFLLGIAGRVAHEMRRAASRHAQRHEAAALATADPANPPEEYHLEEAIAALPESPRQVVLLRFYGQLSCQEVADRLGLPLGTVTKTLSRAYAQLRQILKSQQPTDALRRVEDET